MQMKNIFKQLEGWATHSSQSNFRKAVILLTTYYTIGVFVVLAIFNIMVYSLFSNSIQSPRNENIEIVLGQKNIDENQIEEIQDNLINILLVSDLLILIITLVVAYVSSKRTLAPLEESYRKQARFVADAAHELRTPLAVMQAGSEMILSKNRTYSEYIKFTEESLEEVKRLTTLSNDLLFLAQNNKKKESLKSEVFFSDICKKQVDIMRAYADVKQVQINESINSNIIINGNKDDLIRLVINLLKNAIDYNKVQGTVTLSLERKNSDIILSVIDTGIGIEKEELSHIFERFYKIDNSRTQNSSGAGLGLSIIKEIVDEHNGTIKVSSVRGEGTTFSVIFQGI